MTEELKQIAEIINNLSGDAATAFAWLMAYLVLRLTLICGTILFGITAATRLIRFYVHHLNLINHIGQELNLRTDTDAGCEQILTWVRDKNRQPTPIPAPAPPAQPAPPTIPQPAKPKKHSRRYQTN